MTQDRQPAPDSQEAAPVKAPRNPFIINFCKVLVEKKGEKHEPEALKKLLDKMYGVYEYMLGQNMVKSLPEEVRKEYLAMADDLSTLDYEKIGEVFDKNIANYEEIMKSTMKQFAETFMKNRDFNADDFSVSSDSQPA